jgi:hypothetical protein
MTNDEHMQWIYALLLFNHVNQIKNCPFGCVVHFREKKTLQNPETVPIIKFTETATRNAKNKCKLKEKLLLITWMNEAHREGNNALDELGHHLWPNKKFVIFIDGQLPFFFLYVLKSYININIIHFIVPTNFSAQITPYPVQMKCPSSQPIVFNLYET